ncbi:MAG: hypothetical protein V1819_02155 [bacterium]
MDYLKYYHLENYLFDEARKNFTEQHFLTPEEFFCIVIWKSNRAKTAIKKKLLRFGDLDIKIKELTSQIYFASEPCAKLKILLKNWRFSLPMATAILTVLYPMDFTIYDVRVRHQLEQKEIYGVKAYFEKFLPAVKKIAKEKRLSLRDTDRYLFGKSFYEDLVKFLK